MISQRKERTPLPTPTSVGDNFEGKSKIKTDNNIEMNTSSIVDHQQFLKPNMKFEYYRNKCDKCSYVDFFGPVSMQRHQWQYHSSMVELRKNNFCGICAKRYENRVDYNEHMEWHNADSDTDAEVFQINNFREVCVVSHNLEKMSRDPKAAEDDLGHQVAMFEETMLKKLNPKIRNTFVTNVKKEKVVIKTEPKMVIKTEPNMVIKTEPKVEPLRMESSHNMSLKPSNTKVYTCEFCNYATKEQGNYKRHINVHIKKDDGSVRRERQRREKKKISCTVRGCTFETQETGNFSRHMATHGIVERNKVLNKCHKCEFTAEGYQKLNFHCLREHYQSALHQCEFCSGVFNTSVILKEHRYSHAVAIKGETNMM